MRNLYYAALIHSGYIVKDPLYFSENVFALINTAFSVNNPIEEIVVTDADLATLDPPAEEIQETETTDEVINLDDNNEPIVI